MCVWYEGLNYAPAQSSRPAPRVLHSPRMFSALLVAGGLVAVAVVAALASQASPPLNRLSLRSSAVGKGFRIDRVVDLPCVVHTSLARSRMLARRELRGALRVRAIALS